MAAQIITLNVQGLRTAIHRDVSLIQWLNCFRPEIVCLQETHATSIQEFSSWFAGTHFNCIYSAGTNRSCGVGMLIHPSFNIEHQWRDTAGRYACLNYSNRTLPSEFTVYTVRTHLLLVTTSLVPFYHILIHLSQIFIAVTLTQFWIHHWTVEAVIPILHGPTTVQNHCHPSSKPRRTVIFGDIATRLISNSLGIVPTVLKALDWI